MRTYICIHTYRKYHGMSGLIREEFVLIIVQRRLGYVYMHLCAYVRIYVHPGFVSKYSAKLPAVCIHGCTSVCAYVGTPRICLRMVQTSSSMYAYI